MSRSPFCHVVSLMVRSCTDRSEPGQYPQGGASGQVRPLNPATARCNAIVRWAARLALTTSNHRAFWATAAGRVARCAGADLASNVRRVSGHSLNGRYDDGSVAREDEVERALERSRGPTHRRSHQAGSAARSPWSRQLGRRAQLCAVHRASTMYVSRGLGSPRAGTSDRAAVQALRALARTADDLVGQHGRSLTVSRGRHARR
jgi:hypothetical protein